MQKKLFMLTRFITNTGKSQTRSIYNSTIEISIIPYDRASTSNAEYSRLTTQDTTLEI